VLVQTEELAGQLEDFMVALDTAGAAYLLVFSHDAYDVGLLAVSVSPASEMA
jgi:hypothetical protein